MVYLIKRALIIFFFAQIYSLYTQAQPVNIATFFGPGDDPALGTAVTFAFSDAIQEKQLCLADFDTLKNMYIMTKYTYMISGGIGYETYEELQKQNAFEKVKQSFSDLQKNWSIYSNPNNTLFLLIPKEIKKSLSELGFNKNLKSIDSKALIKDLDHNFMEIKATFFDMKEFEEFFDTSSQIPRRFVFVGHGTLKKIIGISIDNYKKLLAILNQLSTDIVVIISCFAGGEHLLAHYQTIIEKHKQKDPNKPPIVYETTFIPFNYTIMVTGLTNNPIAWPEKSFRGFFSNADKLYTQKQPVSYKSLLAPLKFPISATPSIRFPGTHFFRAVNVDDLVEPVTYNTISTLKFQKALAQEIDIEKLMKQGLPFEAITRRLLLKEIEPNLAINVNDKKQAILLYPTVIDVPINIQPNKKFPMIVSMIPTQSRHYIKSIEASTFTLDQIIDGFLFSTPLDLPTPFYVTPESFFIGELTCVVDKKLTTLEQVVIYRYIIYKYNAKNELYERHDDVYILFKDNNNFYRYEPKTKKRVPEPYPVAKYTMLATTTKPPESFLQAWSGERDTNKNFESMIERVFKVTLPPSEPKQEPLIEQIIIRGAKEETPISKEEQPTITFEEVDDDPVIPEPETSSTVTFEEVDDYPVISEPETSSTVTFEEIDDE